MSPLVSIRNLEVAWPSSKFKETYFKTRKRFRKFRRQYQTLKLSKLRSLKMIDSRIFRLVDTLHQEGAVDFLVLMMKEQMAQAVMEGSMETYILFQLKKVKHRGKGLVQLVIQEVI